ncbi:hypothetical protein FIBSPDRAFT_38098 [Athelia psychrophila]|uniref:Uncharacterized protein n=1 Tax=Athelia psychrophila TaxID=1759441 RepID=A0A166FQQ4_9AGAM|nr:hypothetical protein FIBSPDRAFT_38098 [Fibularhizoctonia sp. CBS 109695]
MLCLRCQTRKTTAKEEERYHLIPILLNQKPWILGRTWWSDSKLRLINAGHMLGTGGAQAPPCCVNAWKTHFC